VPEHVERERLEVQAVGGHHLDPAGVTGRQHRRALGIGHRQRLLAQHMDAGPRRLYRLLRML
jgi:hypothetical protein